jgi:hypothetical protein
MVSTSVDRSTECRTGCDIWACLSESSSVGLARIDRQVEMSHDLVLFFLAVGRGPRKETPICRQRTAGCKYETGRIARLDEESESTRGTKTGALLNGRPPKWLYVGCIAVLFGKDIVHGCQRHNIVFVEPFREEWEGMLAAASGTDPSSTIWPTKILSRWRQHATEHAHRAIFRSRRKTNFQVGKSCPTVVLAIDVVDATAQLKNGTVLLPAKLICAQVKHQV